MQKDQCKNGKLLDVDPWVGLSFNVNNMYNKVSSIKILANELIEMQTCDKNG